VTSEEPPSAKSSYEQSSFQCVYFQLGLVGIVIRSDVSASLPKYQSIAQLLE